MADETNQNSAAADSTAKSQEHHGILDKSLADVLQNNLQAQNMVMKSMRLSPQQLKDMLNNTNNNQLMHMSIADLFKSGFVQQAVSTVGNPASGQMPAQQGQVPIAASGQAVQVTPEQMQQLINAMPNGQISPEQFQQITGQELEEGQQAQSVVMLQPKNSQQTQTSQQPQKPSFLQKVKGLF